MWFPDPIALLLPVARSWAPPAGFDGLTVADEVPVTRQAGGPPLIVLRRSGGVASRFRDEPRIDWLCWAGTKYQALRLAGWAREQSDALHGTSLTSERGTHAVSVLSEFAGPQPYPDPAGAAVPIAMFTHEYAIRGK